MIYAVNKQTKEHRVVGCHNAILMREFYFAQADDDGWIGWSGGECPLPGDQLCEVKLGHSQQKTTEGARPARDRRWTWERRGYDGDITAYRPSLDDKPKAPDDCVTVRYDLDPASVEGAIRDKLIEMGWTPPKSGREKWIEAAIHAHVNAPYPSSEFEAIYDALKSGKLPQP